MNPEQMKILKMQHHRILLERRIRNDELRLTNCEIRINRIFDIETRIIARMKTNIEKHKKYYGEIKCQENP